MTEYGDVIEYTIYTIAVTALIALCILLYGEKD